MTAAEKKAQEAEATQSATEKKEIPAPTGAGKFSDMVEVKGTAKHPTLAGKKYFVHSAHVPYLENKGFIE